MTLKKFVVAVPGRPAPLCIEAEEGYLMGEGAEFTVDGKIVAALPEVVLVSEVQVLVAFPENVPPFTYPLICTDDQLERLAQLEVGSQRLHSACFDRLRRCLPWLKCLFWFSVLACLAWVVVDYDKLL